MLRVSHLAAELGKQVKNAQPALEVRDSDLKLLRLSALCHDLGHGPFSHVFQEWAGQRCKE